MVWTYNVCCLFNFKILLYGLHNLGSYRKCIGESISGGAFRITDSAAEANCV